MRETGLLWIGILLASLWLYRVKDKMENSATSVVETTTPGSWRSVLVVAGIAVFLAGTLLLFGSSALNRHKSNTIVQGRSKGDTRDLSPLLLFVRVVGNSADQEWLPYR